MGRLASLVLFAVLFSGCGSSHDPDDDAGTDDTGSEDAGSDDTGTAEHPLTPRWRALTNQFNQNGCACEVEAGESPSVEACLETAEDFGPSITCLDEAFRTATEGEIEAYECLTDGLERSAACSEAMGCGPDASATCLVVEQNELRGCEDIFDDDTPDPFSTCGI